MLPYFGLDWAWTHCYLDRMPRIARIVIAGVPHHVTQRGNLRADVVWTDQDRRRYLASLAEYAARHALAGLRSRV